MCWVLFRGKAPSFELSLKRTLRRCERICLFHVGHNLLQRLSSRLARCSLNLDNLVDSCLALRNVHLVADIAVVSPVVDLILILSSVQRSNWDGELPYLAASTRLTCGFVVTVANCYNGRWSELNVGVRDSKAQNPPFWAAAWRLGTTLKRDGEKLGAKGST